MAGNFFLAALAAFGTLCLLWTLFGWLLPGAKGCAVIFYGPVEPERLAIFAWLRGLGLLNCPILIVSEGDAPPVTGAEYCTGEKLLPRLKEERNRDYGTGTGDSPGHGQCRGISEL